MKTILITILTIASFDAFAFPDTALEHMDLVDLTHTPLTRIEFNINYPGLGNAQYNNPDCLMLLVPKSFVTKEELMHFSKLVTLNDGDRILFPDPSRNLNQLVPEIINKQKPILIFKLQDLGTYLTGLRITNFTIYATFQNAVESAFGKLNGTTALQFLRGCEL